MKDILKRFGDLSIKYKLSCILAPALIALICFNTISIVEKIGDVREITHIKAFTNLALEISGLVDEVQKERGMSGMYLASGGAKFEAEMNAQRAVTDVRVKRLQGFLSTFKDKELEEPIKQAMEYLKKLEDQRVEVSTLSNTLKDTMKFYSDIDVLLLNIVGMMPNLMSDGELAYHFMGFYSTQMYKEPMGVELAILSGAFTSNKFAPGAYRMLIECIRSQELYKNLYLTSMPADDRQVLLDALKDPNFAKSEQYRELAVSKVNEDRFDVDSKEWVAVQSKKMELIHDKLIIGHLQTEILKVTGARSSGAWSALVLTLVISIAILIVTLIVAVSIAGGITRSVRETGHVMGEIAKGDFTQEVPVRSHDEMGALGENVNAMVSDLREMFGGIRQDSETLARSAEGLSAVSTQLATGSSEMTNQASGVASATEQMSANIGSMAAGVEEASVNASTVSSTAEQMSVNMGSIASAIEEMSTTIREIAKNSEDTSRVANRAMGMSKTATDTMVQLGNAANEIGKVTAMIKRIAEQTNLLALNATIEAASAGDAGKGFAVVANEIKELANQSARAAEDIAAKIEGVQGSTTSAVKVITDVSDIIGKINSAVNVITGSVNQQTLAANEISKNVVEVTAGANNIASSIAEIAKGAGDMAKSAGEAAKGANEVSANIIGITKAVGDNNTGIQQIRASSDQLAKIAEGLQAMVAKFKVEPDDEHRREISLS